MKHHIAVKFIAVILAALSLLAVVGSAAGIIVLATADLYSQSVDDLHAQQMESERREFAVNLAHRYASLNLGKLPEAYLDEYYGTYWYYSTFEYGYFFYTIKDEQGNIVESTVEVLSEDAVRYEIGVTDIRYRRVVHDQPSGEDMLPLEDATLPHNETIPDSTEPVATAAEEVRETTVTETMETTSPASTTEDILVDAADADTTMKSVEGTVPETSGIYSGEDSLAAASWVMETQETYSDWYYDYELDSYVQLSWQYADLPPYTVELYLLPGAMPDEYMWTLLEEVWNLRNELFYVLGFGLLGFAITIVYLCCAAGKKPGREEIRAEGLNRIPLDLYLGADILIVIFAVVFGAEAAWYLVQEASPLVIPFTALVGYGCALLVVGFLFAFAAQVKTPDRYWWRNSIGGRCLRLIAWLWNHFIDGCVWTGQHLPAAVKKTGGTLWGWAVILWGVLVKLVLALYELVKKLLLFLWAKLLLCLKWIGGKLTRFFSMLPLTWQWLLTAFGMLFLAFIAFNSNDGGWLLLCLGVYTAIVLYGTQAFGILSEGAKRMSKGDLDTKVDDKMLTGSFKEFAGDLNALSEVAVVAAQKQMKAERMRTELITNVSHDIKTPLTSIINYVDLMDKPHTPEEQEQYLEVLSRQSQRLKKLIDDLMEMSKASTGNLAVDITEVNAEEAINQALGEFADKLERAQLTPVFRAPETPITMRADGRLVWRVLSNVLSNAVKYALPGTRVYIDLMELDGKVVISLKNISRDELNVSADELLERFVRGDSSRNTEGSGLGLNIAQSLMELQKGQLQLLVDGDLFKVTLIFPGAY